MKKIKFLLFICLFFLTGCSATYEITISDNIKEEITFYEDISLITSFSSIDNYLLEETNLVKAEDKYKYYNILTTYDDNYAYGIGNRSYDDFNSFKNNSIIFNDIFEDIEYVKKKDKINLSMKTKDLSSYFENSDLYTEFVDKLKIKINVKNKIIDGNYNYLSGNSAIWILDKNNSNITIDLSYSNKKNNIIVYVFIGIIMFIAFFIFTTYLKYKKERRLS